MTLRRSPVRARAGLVAVAAAAGLLSAGPTSAYSTGPPPDRVGLCEARATCKDAMCHDTYPLDAGSAVATLEIDGAPPATYGPGQLMQFVLTVTDSDLSRQRFGFQLGIVSNCPFADEEGGFNITDSARTQLNTGGVLPFVQHRCQTLGDPSACGYLPETTGRNQWSWEWTAPADSAAGQLRIFWAINASDGDSTPDDDYITLWQAVLDPACPGRVETLQLRRAECDPTAPGVRKVELSWDPVAFARGYRIYRTEDPAVLVDPGGLGADVLAGPCDEVAGAARLELYSVVGLCADLSDGPR